MNRNVSVLLYLICIASPLIAQTPDLYPVNAQGFPVNAQSALVVGEKEYHLSVASSDKNIFPSLSTVLAWAEVELNEDNRLEIRITETNTTPVAREGFIYIEYMRESSACRDSILLVQPGHIQQKGMNGAEGKHFWFAFLENRWNEVTSAPAGTNILSFYTVAARQAALGTYTITETGNSYAFTAATHTTSTYTSADLLHAYNTESEQILKKSVYVEADQPLLLYAMNWQRENAVTTNVSMDIVNVLPEEALGDEYMVVSYNENYAATTDMFLIIATENNTLVTILPAMTTAGGRPADHAFTIALNKGETYLVKAADGASVHTSYVKATKPVAVFVGHKQASVNCSLPADEHFFEQMLPVSALGNIYPLIAANPASQTIYRVTASHHETLFPTYFANPFSPGEFITFLANSSVPSMVPATKNYSCVMYGHTRGCGVSRGAPLMMRMTSMSHTVSDIKFAVPSLPIAPLTHTMLVFVNAGTEQHTTLWRYNTDAAIAPESIPLFFQEAPNSAYAFARTSVDPAVYRLQNADGFTAYVYGMDNQTAYGYAVGGRYNAVPPPELSNLVFYVGQPVPSPYDAGSASYSWYLSEDAEVPLVEAPTVDTSLPNEKTYYISQTIDGSESPRRSAKITVKAVTRLYDYDTLVVGIQGSGMKLSSVPASYTAHTVTKNVDWITLTPMLNGDLHIAVTESNMTGVERIGYIYIEHNGQHDTIVLIQPSRTCVQGIEGTDGRKFWLAFLENIYPSYTSQLNLDIIATSDRDATVTISNPATGWSDTFFIPANTIVTKAVPEAQVYNTQGETKNKRALYVESDVKISLYANNFQSLSSDAANIFPEEALGDEYYTLSYNANVAGKGVESGNVATPEEFLIIATENNTLVTIVPTSETGGGMVADNPVTIRMNKGETFLVKSKLGGTITNTSYYKSITGSYIKSNKLVAVFAGHKRAKISCPGSNSRDHLYEQLFPLRLWGTDYAVASTGQSKDLYRIVAAYDNTQITINGAPVPPLDRGKYVDYYVMQDECDVIKANYPITVGLFTESMDCLGATEGDPFMIVLNPVDNQITDIVYSPLPSANIVHHYTNILVKSNVKQKTTLTNLSTGGTVTLDFIDAPGGEYAYARVVVPPDPHRLQNNEGFIAYAYGYGQAESYGYSVGARFNHMDYPSIHDTTYCVGETPKALSEYDVDNNFLWYASAEATTYTTTPPVFTTAAAATYTFYVSQLIECSESPRKKITVTVHPLPVVTFPDAATCNTTVPLEVAWPKGGIYTGAGCDSLFYPHLAGPGNHALTYTCVNAYGCATSATATVTVHPLPVITALGTTTFCVGSSVTLFTTAPAATYQWYKDGVPVSGNTNTYTTSESGSYTLLITDAQGCVASQASNEVVVTVHPLPSTPVITTSGATTFCVGSSVTLFTTAPAATYQWYKDGVPVSGNNTNSYTVSESGAYILTITDAQGCMAPQASNAIVLTQINLPGVPVIDAPPSTGFCSGQSVVLTVQANQAVAYQWYRNDQLLGTFTDPTYTVMKGGVYKVIAVNANNCYSKQASENVHMIEHALPVKPVITTHPPFYNGYNYVLEVQLPETDVRYDWYRNYTFTDVAGTQYRLTNLQFGDAAAYMVEAVTEHDCRLWSDELLVEVEPAPLFIPNVFTPNNDGVNDNFQIAGLDSYVENELQILNKRGKIIYSAKNYHNEWNGDNQPTDVYYYSLTLKDKNGTVSNHTGYLQLKR